MARKITVDQLNTAMQAAKDYSDILDVTDEEVKQAFEAAGNTSLNNTYSFEEQRVGTWVDGKPIYRRTYKTTMPSGNMPGIFVDIGANIETVVSISGIFYYEFAGVWQSLMCGKDAFDKFAKISVYDGNAYEERSKQKIRILSSFDDWAGSLCYVTIEYTKA